jgi:PKD repeat protein
MRKKILMGVLVTLALIGVKTTNAQGSLTCASDQINDSLLMHDPIFYMGFMHFEEMLEARRNEPVEERSNEVYTLPVVVHIIHKGEPYGSGSNITDEQVFSAITALNQDFRRMSGTNGYGNGPDIGIEFCMAVRDPNGQPTNGINRVNGTTVPDYAQKGIAVSSSSTNGASEAAVKALSTWPRASYMNVWVVAEIENNDGGSGVQGYAYFPTNSPLDGIVLLYNAFGTVGNLKSYTNLNRTFTHEVGHYLNLYHTFHNTTACGTEGNCTTAGDRVCDTPVTIQSGSCSTPACGGTQQVQNYMDYTGQICQNMFTEGQKLRMRTALEVQRTSMLSSLGCVAVNDRDAGITAILSPNGYICPGGVQPKVTLTNFGNATLTSATIHYNLNGVGSQSQTWTGSLASGASTTVTLNTITPSNGAQTLYAWTSNPNNQTDQNTSNDQSSGAFTVASGGSATLSVRLDYFGSETTWRITDSNNNMLLNGGPYEDYAQGTVHTHNICLPPGCYTLTFYDAHNDGQGFTNGHFFLSNASGDTLAYRQGNWGQISVNPFCLQASSQAPVASFSVADNTICQNTSASFTSTSTGQPTTYQWSFPGGSPSSSTAQNPQNITYANPGVYNVTLTVSNSNGSHTYTCTNCITVYALPTLTLTGTNPSCNNGTNGSVVSNVGNGVSPFTYNWNNGQTTANLSNVGAGTYSLTVTNGNGCTRQASTTLTNPSEITVTGTTTNVSCANGTNGSITVTASGGTGTKTFTWSNGATGSTASNLAPGTYTVTAKDANNCTKTQSFTITAPAALTVQGTVNNPTCTNSQSGSITVTSTGGTGSKTYTWSHGATGSTVSNLGAGSYTVTVKDANNCTASQTFQVVSPSSIVVSAQTNNPTCNGTNSGSITVSATGATGITFVWNNGTTGNTLNNIGAGTYSVTASSASGCSVTQTYTLTAPQAIQVNLTKNDITCSGGFGTAQVSPVGGTSPYQVSWSHGATGTSVNGLAAGSYTVTVTDANGCTAQSSFSITALAGLAINIASTDVSCNGESNGTATVSVQGGSGTYTYLWNTDANTAQISGLSSGTYSVVVTDSNGCQGSSQVTITQPAALSATAAVTDVACFGGNDGTIQLTPQGGTAPYSYSWSNGATSANNSQLEAGEYSVMIADSKGCVYQQTYNVEQAQLLTLNVIVVDSESCDGNDGAAEAMVTGGTGNYSINWGNNATGTILENASAGNYTVTVTDVNGCTVVGHVVIPYECTTPVAQTQLTSEYCGAEELQLSDIVYCEAVTGASMYMWRFVSEEDVVISDEYSLSNMFQVNQMPSALPGMRYNVVVKALVDGVWGQFGNVCVIGIEGEPEPILPQLNEESCGMEIHSWGQNLVAIYVPNAQTYQWHITSSNYDWTTYTTTNELVMDEAMQLIAGTVYSVRIRCAMGQGQFTDWGPSCNFKINLAINVQAFPPIDGILHFYPNPCDGEKIIFDFGNLPSGSIVEDLEIYNGVGQLIEKMNKGFSASSGTTYEYRFNSTLASGMYVIRYNFNGIASEEKLIVR